MSTDPTSTDPTGVEPAPTRSTTPRPQPVRLSVGDPAPDFSLPTSGGGTFTLSECRGENVVVYFYPAAMTCGCITQAGEFRDNLAALRAGGYTVLGVSPDKVNKLDRFVDAETLTFPLASDEDRSVMGAYGVFEEKNLYGRTVMGTIRSTFVVDPEGKIAHAAYNVRAKGHVARLRRDLGLR